MQAGEPGPQPNPQWAVPFPAGRAWKGKQEVPDPPSSPPTVAFGLVDLFQGIRLSPLPKYVPAYILSGNIGILHILEEPLVPKASLLPIFIC